MDDIVILSAVRTPIGAFQGAFKRLSTPVLGAAAIAGAVERAGVEPGSVGQVYMGCVLPAGLGQAPARQASMAAGLPASTGAVTLNKVCGSGMRAVMSVANDLRCGDYEVSVAGGMENMSRSPFLAAGLRDGLRLGHGKLVDSMLHDGLWDAYGDVHMGSCGELCARDYSLSREDQDAYARESYRRARAAIESGKTADEIVPVEVPRGKGEPLIVKRDEEPFRVDLERMSSLKSAFESDGTITAANASTLNDGAAALVLTTARHAERLGVKPLARLVAQAGFAQQPEWFTTAPVGAAKAVLERAGLGVGDIGLWEVNEAFAVVTQAFMADFELDPEIVNVRGGAVALGHPIGCSGARIIVTLLAAMAERRTRRGLAAICLGGGEATAVIVEREAA